MGHRGHAQRWAHRWHTPASHLQQLEWQGLPHSHGRPPKYLLHYCLKHYLQIVHIGRTERKTSQDLKFLHNFTHGISFATHQPSLWCSAKEHSEAWAASPLGMPKRYHCFHSRKKQPMVLKEASPTYKIKSNIYPLRPSGGLSTNKIQSRRSESLLWTQLEVTGLDSNQSPWEDWGLCVTCLHIR